MRFQETHGEEERLGLCLQDCQAFHRFSCRGTIWQFIVGFQAYLESGSFLCAFSILTLGTIIARRSKFFYVDVMSSDDLLCVVDEVRVDGTTLRIPMWLIPRATIFETRVIHFA